MPQPEPSILIIDNDEGVVRALETRLGANGYRCVTAGSGSQGLAMFQEAEIALVITDLNMPAGDGVNLATSIRERSDVPIIVITGFRKNFARDLRHIGNLTVIEKPFEADELLEIIEAELVLAGRDLP